MAVSTLECCSGLSRSSFRGLLVVPASARFSSAENFRLSPSQLNKRRRELRERLAISRASSQQEDWVKQVGKALWGRGLPPGALVDVARQLWGTGWQVMMGQLAPTREKGAYDRPNSQFRSRPKTGATVIPGNFHLYVATTCPWAHRALIVHSLKGLGDAVPVSVVVPGTSGLWEFSSGIGNSAGEGGQFTGTKDRANGQLRLLDVYKLRKESYNGRATVPMLWDQGAMDVLNNESADIIEILNSDFNEVAENPGLDLAPAFLKAEIDRWNSVIYPDVNNGVYRCGFAQGQEAYEAAVENLFKTLNRLEEHLATSRYLCGDCLTLADVRLFTTLYRFDAVYNILFKCTRQKLSELSNLYGYLRDIYQIPGVASTCDMPAIMDGYYRVLFPLNPGSLCPAIPKSAEGASLLEPHGRERLSKVVVGANN
ncbi:hypothetical protein R1flu_022167 [Riccia fluitans]|uniref:GST C-terminal domain-containing protein n=1 Tax=Riccia fluitans TaxID=41844 RepID=A0ABD1ZUC3_9MARC